MSQDNEDDVKAILASPSYVLAHEDVNLLSRHELRPVRVQLELLKPELTLAEHHVTSTIVVFGSTKIMQRSEAEKRLEKARAALALDPQDARLAKDAARCEKLLELAPYYEEARRFAALVSSRCQLAGACEFVIVTGGGPGIMEAANRGAHDVGAKSIGLNITLPAEQLPNRYITPELCFQFHYFAMRKMHFLLRAKALVVFPGGYGTMDELTDALTLRQTRRMQEIPIIMAGRAHWENAINFRFLSEQGLIEDKDLALISFAETAEEIWDVIMKFHEKKNNG